MTLWCENTTRDYVNAYFFLRDVLFFFQAEDGIRDGHVTGVQTCALPICHGQARTVERDGEAEVAERCRAVLAQPDVAGLEVAVNDAAPVRVLQRAADFASDTHRFVRREAVEIGRASCRERGWSAGGGVA